MPARWMQAKTRKRQLARRKAPRRYNPFLLKDLYGKNHLQNAPEDDNILSIVPQVEFELRAWQDQLRKKNELEQLRTTRAGQPQEVWYKEDLDQDVWLIFQCSKNQYRFVSKYTMNRSFTYPSRERAMTDYRNGEIKWSSRTEN